MSKPQNLDLILKLRLRRILFSQGYWCPIEVELSHYEPEQNGFRRTSLTDLDVLAVRFDQLFTPFKIVGDCKTGKNVSDANRLFWLRGVMDYFGANQAYFIRTRIDNHARAIAPKLALRVLDENDLLSLEKTLGSESGKLPISDWKIQEEITELWGIDVAPGVKPTADELQLKQAYSYLSYAYWYIEPHRSLFSLVSHFERIAPLLNPANPRHILLAFTGAERFCYSILEMLAFVQSQGGSEVLKYGRTYLYGGTLGLKEKEQFFSLLRKATGTNESLDPDWLNQVFELTNRLLRNPIGASDVLRYISAAYLWCAHLKNSSFLQVDEGKPVNTAALVLAKDSCDTFAKVCGLSQSMFQAIKGL